MTRDRLPLPGSDLPEVDDCVDRLPGLLLREVRRSLRSGAPGSLSASALSQPGALVGKPPVLTAGWE